MLDWLKKIIDNAEVTDGEALQAAIEKEFPAHAVPKSDFNSVKEKLKAAESTIKELNKNNTDNEALQNEIKKYKDRVTELENEAVTTRKTYALKEKLQEAGAVDADYIIYKQGGIDKFTFDEDDKPIGIDDILKPVREASPHLFKAEPQSGYKPASGGKPPIDNPFAKETWNLTKQGELLKTNRTQAVELAAAAGVKLQ